MARILLADDSPHAQRMGERILRDEGYEVVTVTDGETALLRLADVAPDLVMADVALPKKSGYDLCEHIKADQALRFTRVVLTAGMLARVDSARAASAGSDGLVLKPFEASVLLDTLRPLLAASDFARGVVDAVKEEEAKLPPPAAPPPDPELVRAAVTLALDAALPAMVDEVTAKVMLALKR